MNKLFRYTFQKKPTNFIKCIYKLADTNKYWYLKLREELIKLRHNYIIAPKYFHLEKSKLISIMACFIYVLWGENIKFEAIINKLKQVFHIGTGHKQIFQYIGIKLEQKSDFLSLSLRRITSTLYIQFP